MVNDGKNKHIINMITIPLSLLSFATVIIANNVPTTPNGQSMSSRSFNNSNNSNQSMQQQQFKPDTEALVICDSCTCDRCPARCEVCAPTCGKLPASDSNNNNNVKQATKMPNTVEIVDAADDLPKNGTPPTTESLTTRMDQVMKKINTICLKDYTNLMEYRKSIIIMRSKGIGPSTESTVSELRMNMRGDSAPGFVDFFTENTTQHVIDLWEGADSRADSPTTPLPGYLTLAHENPKNSPPTTVREITTTSSPLSSKFAPPTISGFSGQISMEPMRSQSSSRGIVKFKKSVNSGTNNGIISNNNNVNKCIEALIEFAELIKDFRIWYNEKLREASSIILNSLNLGANK